MTGPRVLMLTGAYHPEVSGGGMQCRALVHALRSFARFAVLTTCRDPSLPRAADDYGVRVVRVPVGRGSTLAQAAAGLRLAVHLVRLRHHVLHLHGFSAKSVVALLAARALGRRTVLTVHTAGYDDPESQRRRRLSALRLRLYRGIDRFVAVSPGLRAACVGAGLPPERVVHIPNGVDCARFRPARDAAEKRAARSALGLPVDASIALFVGFFSRDKGPHVATEAWQRARAQGLDLVLVMVGSTDAGYHEVDRDFVASAQRLSRASNGRLRLVERAADIAVHYRAADTFLLPSVREACPLGLLEAMATGLPCVAFRLEGATDAIIRSGEDGLLVPPGDVEAFSAAVTSLLADAASGRRLGAAARHTAETRHTVDGMAQAYLGCYRDVLGAAAASLSARPRGEADAPCR